MTQKRISVKFKLSDITVVITNWMSTRVTLGAIKNIRKLYPQIPVVVVDNGSIKNDVGKFNHWYKGIDAKSRLDNNLNKLEDESKKEGFDLIILENNFGHGGAVDYGVYAVKTKLALIMDNDVRVLKPGIVEEFLDKMNEDPEHIYAVGPMYNYCEIARGKYPGVNFSLYQVGPITQNHLSFNYMCFQIPEEIELSIDPGYLVYSFLTKREMVSFLYPEINKFSGVCHLKSRDGDGLERWNKWIDG